ncbi:hypothetical protein PsYK624_045600 [Phanerochaete sordida]|uniref:Uncharacterized protein n=1 Tax=Phanerochaete sordida TaxID=48140 RepID=A0A9P3G3K9_9APHY|nr:hypothetical protein PsYK624_045600 [Phanerochaete sordida]
MRSSIGFTELTDPIVELPETLVPLPNLRIFHAAQYVSQVSSATHLLMLVAPHAECCIHLEVLTFYWSVPLPTMTAMVTSLAFKLSTLPAARDAFHIALEVNMPQGQWLDFSVGRRPPGGGAAMRKQLQVSIDLSGEDDAYIAELVRHIWASALLAGVVDVAVERLDASDAHVVPLLDGPRSADVEALRIACPVSLSVFADALESHLEVPDAVDPFPRLRSVTVDTAKVGPAECVWERTPLERVLDAVGRRKESGLGPMLVLI